MTPKEFSNEAGFAGLGVSVGAIVVTNRIARKFPTDERYRRDPRADSAKIIDPLAHAQANDVQDYKYGQQNDAKHSTQTPYCQPATRIAGRAQIVSPNRRDAAYKPGGIVTYAALQRESETLEQRTPKSAESHRSSLKSVPLSDRRPQTSRHVLAGPSLGLGLYPRRLPGACRCRRPCAARKQSTAHPTNRVEAARRG